jgi:hypothetical protein
LPNFNLAETSPVNTKVFVALAVDLCLVEAATGEEATVADTATTETPRTLAPAMTNAAKVLCKSDHLPWVFEMVYADKCAHPPLGLRYLGVGGTSAGDRGRRWQTRGHDVFVEKPAHHEALRQAGAEPAPPTSRLLPAHFTTAMAEASAVGRVGWTPERKNRPENGTRLEQGVLTGAGGSAPAPAAGVGRRE